MKTGKYGSGLAGREGNKYKKVVSLNYISLEGMGSPTPPSWLMAEKSEKWGEKSPPKKSVLRNPNICTIYE
jgi:hypothetical protein